MARTEEGSTYEFPTEKDVMDLLRSDMYGAEQFSRKFGPKALEFFSQDRQMDRDTLSSMLREWERIGDYRRPRSVVPQSPMPDTTSDEDDDDDADMFLPRR